MGYEFNEFHFVGAHMETVNRVLMKPNQSSALKLLHLNKLILKQKTPKPEEDDATPAGDQPSTSTTPVAPVKARKTVTPKRKRSKSTTPLPEVEKQPGTPPTPVAQVEEQPATAPTLVAEVKAPTMVTVGTQTTLEVVAVDPPPEKEEEVFNTFHLKSMRQQYLVTSKRPQDFDETEEEDVVREREEQQKVVDEGKRVFKKSKIFKDPYQ